MERTCLPIASIRPSDLPSINAFVTVEILYHSPFAFTESLPGFCFEHSICPGTHRIHSRRRFRAVNSLDCANELHDGLMIMHHPVLLCGEQEMQAVSELLAGQ